MDYQKQTDRPLFPKVLWNRPLTRGAAGRLLLVGGHSGSFSNLQAVYQMAQAAGVGQVLLAMPDNLERTLAGLPDARWLPANPSGALGKAALGQLLELARDSDALVIGADLSGSSETSVLIESLVDQADRPIVAFGEAFKVLKHRLEPLLKRPDALLIFDTREAMQLSNLLNIPVRITADAGVHNKIDLVAGLRERGGSDLVMASRELIVTAVGQTSLTTGVSAMEFFLPAVVGVAATFWIQNQSQRFEGLTAAAYALRQAREQVSSGGEQALLVTELAKAVQKVLREEDF